VVWWMYGRQVGMVVSERTKQRSSEAEKTHPYKEEGGMRSLSEELGREVTARSVADMGVGAGTDTNAGDPGPGPGSAGAQHWQICMSSEEWAWSLGCNEHESEPVHMGEHVHVLMACARKLVPVGCRQHAAAALRSAFVGQ
jgi:hypothetical protein